MLRFNRFSIVLCTVLIGISQCRPDAPPKKQKVMKIDNVESEINKDLMTMTVNIKQSDLGSIIDVDAELFKEIPSEVYVNIIVSKKSGQTEYKPLVKPGRQNMCEYMKHPEKEPILKMILDRLNQFGEMNFNCPVKAGKFYLKGFYIEASSLPSYAPPGSYKVEFAVTRKDKNDHILLFKMIWYATILLE